jgi:hypothetical protein
MFKRLFGADESNSFGKSSFACAAIACVLFLALWYVDRAGFALMGGKLLNALNQLGLVRQERSYLAELRPVGFFSVNDTNAVVWLTCIAFIFSALGMVLALYADYRRESTRYASAGFIVATIGIGLVYPMAMVAAQAAGAIALIAIRQCRRRTSVAAPPDENAAFLPSGR